jgi:hypothetical protein
MALPLPVHTWDEPHLVLDLLNPIDMAEALCSVARQFDMQHVLCIAYQLAPCWLKAISSSSLFNAAPLSMLSAAYATPV